MKPKTLNYIAGMILLGVSMLNFYLFAYLSMVYYESENNPIIKLFMGLIALDIIFLFSYSSDFINNRIKENKK